MALENFLQGVVDNPIDLRCWPAAFQAREHWQRLDNIAQCARLDDEDFHGRGYDLVELKTDGSRDKD